jgi:AraC-like DNA-binding protein
VSGKHEHTPKIVYAGGHEGFCDNSDHSHERAWELIYLREGSVTERLEGDSLEMRPGMFVVHPPGAVHGDSASDRFFLYHVLVTLDEPLDWPRSGNDLEGAPILAILELVVREWYSNGPQREAFIRHCASLLDILMKRCAIQAQESYVARNLVATVCGHFRREFHSSINMEDIARDQSISRSTLYTYFNRVLGRTPQEVLQGIRLKHAIYLLKHSELPIEKVAWSAGYYSASHLGRKLRRCYGTTASQIRESCTDQDPLQPGIAKRHNR